MVRLFVISIFILTAICSCYYDSEEYLYPKLNNVCDTTNVTYSGTVAPILQEYCINCHSGQNQVILNTYEGVLVRVNDGSLPGSIKHEAPFRAMPDAGGKLDDCTIAKISIWIDEGALEN